MKRVILGAILLASSAFADSISLRADEWCPYNCNPKSDKPGFMIEIAKEVFEKAGHTIDYQLLPWSRTLRQVADGTYNGAVGASATDSKELIVPSIEQGIAGNVFFVRSDDTWKYDGTAASLEKISLAVIRDYSYGEVVDKYMESAKDKQSKVQIASGDDALDINFKKLLASRVDAVVENKSVGMLKLKELGMLEKVKIAGEDKAEPVYIAFGAKNPKNKEYAELLAKGTESLRKNGKLKEILAKYGLEDWKK